VARRELLERGRSRGFLFSLLLTTALIVASIVVPAILFSDDGQLQVGVVEPAPAGLDAALAQSGPLYGRTVSLQAFPDRATGETALQEERIATLLIVPAELSGPGELVVRRDADDQLRAIVTTAIVGLRTGALLEEAGVDPTAFVAASEPPVVTSQDPSDESESTAFLFANVGVILLFIGIFSFGTWVLMGVVEEKQSRVVEVILSSVRPRDVLMGKVLGIGILGVFQLLVFVAVGLVVVQVMGRLTLPPTTGAAIVQLVVWFCLGYALYATTLGFLGALASRVEEASNASTPVSLAATTAYLVSLLVVTNDPSGTVAVIATLIPFSAPMVVPLRAALDAISPVEIAAAVVITLLTIYVLFVLGGRVYSGAVLQTGGRVKLRDAWRRAESD
jgi:ABC-2 type transport system permease protein